LGGKENQSGENVLKKRGMAQLGFVCHGQQKKDRIGKQAYTNKEVRFDGKRVKSVYQGLLGRTTGLGEKGPVLQKKLADNDPWTKKKERCDLGEQPLERPTCTGPLKQT